MGWNGGCCQWAKCWHGNAATLPALWAWKPDLAIGACGRCSACIIRSPHGCLCLSFHLPPHPLGCTGLLAPLSTDPLCAQRRASELCQQGSLFPKIFLCLATSLDSSLPQSDLPEISCKKWLWNPTLSFFHLSLLRLSLWHLPHLFVYWFIFCLPGREHKPH